MKVYVLLEEYLTYDSTPGVLFDFIWEQTLHTFVKLSLAIVRIYSHLKVLYVGEPVPVRLLILIAYRTEKEDKPNIITLTCIVRHVAVEDNVIFMTTKSCKVVLVDQYKEWILFLQ